MEIREFAERILFSETLEAKLLVPEGELTDERPGGALRIPEPERIDALSLHRARGGPKMPTPDRFALDESRAIAHHIMANHELQALEVMAWTLLAFPDAPTSFRRGQVGVMLEEQRHTRWHLARLEHLGGWFGQFPPSGYVWRRAMQSESLLDYLACIPLTFEGGNLDHSLEFEQRFARVGDRPGAQIMGAIHRDEITHVAFGLSWLKRLGPEGMLDWELYQRHLRWPLEPFKAKGREFDRESRRKAGMSDAFLDLIERAQPTPRQARGAR
ncbi:hypothetical protein Pan216_16580 [Planctomycetes bacterium Pan216]|uniref:DUF455 domain-containing protein n=1 Tax=Kolteria novifilia TaxID=2527975 RepID=A0A518B1K3_9BACT|nr:hypothetical protein Pan216_16580 [Planctomycetes bacterium Pan216]